MGTMRALAIVVSICAQVSIAGAQVAPAPQATPATPPASPASPASPAAPTAEGVFAEGQRLMDAGQVLAACDKFAESQRMEPAPGTQLNLGDCQEQAGRTASAWATFRDAEASSRRAQRPDWEDIARAHAAALEPNLSRITVRIDARVAPSSIEVRRDGVLLGSSDLGSAVPMDPGSHLIEARADGKRTWATTVQVAPRGGLVVVEIPPLEDANAENAASKTPDFLPPREPRPYQRGLGIVVAAVGVVGVAVGSIAGLVAIGKNSDSNRLCPIANPCPNPEGVAATDTARDAAAISTVAFVAGGAAIVAGGILYFTAPSPAAPKTAVLRVGPVSTGDGLGVSLSGRW